jgi:hypothetical protein
MRVKRHSYMRILCHALQEAAQHLRKAGSRTYTSAYVRTHAGTRLKKHTYKCERRSCYGGAELQQSCNRAATELQQSCNRAATMHLHYRRYSLLRSLAGSRAAPPQCGAYAGTGLPAGQRRLSAGAAGFSQLPPHVYG